MPIPAPTPTPLEIGGVSVGPGHADLVEENGERGREGVAVRCGEKRPRDDEGLKGRSRRKKSECEPLRSVKRADRLERQEEIETIAREFEDGLPRRPDTRKECGVVRPCPFVSCRHHLYLDVMRNGTLKKNFPEGGMEEIPATCSLDIADTGSHSLEEVGVLLNMTRERVRQIERILFRKIARKAPELLDLLQPEALLSKMNEAQGKSLLR